MLIYWESCESGSMFDQLLPDDINVFAVTASKPTESSMACNYDSHYGTYISDCFSVSWMTGNMLFSQNKLRYYSSL